MLEAHNITKKYKRRDIKNSYLAAVSDLSLKLEGDKITVIVGESGSGKSTLARMLAYIEKPDEGEIILDGVNVTDCGKSKLRKLRGRVQLVMQDAASSLDPHLSVEKTISEPLVKLRQVDKSDRDREVSGLLDMMGLSGDILGYRPGELSGGQQKRVCIARALAANPEHIIFDESFSGLDVTVKAQILRLLKEVHRKLKIGFLIITHDLETAMYMADSIHVMRRGKIVESIEAPKSLDDFREEYSMELVKAARYKNGLAGSQNL